MFQSTPGGMGDVPRVCCGATKSVNSAKLDEVYNVAQLNRFPPAGQTLPDARMSIDYPFDSLPEAGAVLAVADGVYWLRMPLPFALDHINLWLLQDNDGFTAVDTGIALDPVKDAWRAALAGSHEKSALAGRQVQLTRQIVTHFHPDHLGLAAWLESETGAPLWMSQGEYLTAQVIAEGVPAYGVGAMLGFFRAHGLDDARLAALEKRGNAYKRGVPDIPASFRRIAEGDVLSIGGRDWRVIVGFGHAPEHVSLYCAELGVLISGDMLLPRISTNISVYAANPGGDPLSLFLDSLGRLTDLPADTLVLPSHGRPFRGLHTRVDQLRTHHEERCAELLAACAQAPKSAAELLTVLFGRPIDDPHQTMFAMGEAIAHLNYLEAQRRIERLIENGIIRFTQIN
jgi:glyoxylase-like metal-dependent hydrolase (beta-lactamase superfamily II)